MAATFAAGDVPSAAEMAAIGGEMVAVFDTHSARDAAVNVDGSVVWIRETGSLEMRLVDVWVVLARPTDLAAEVVFPTRVPPTPPVLADVYAATLRGRDGLGGPTSGAWLVDDNGGVVPSSLFDGARLWVLGSGTYRVRRAMVGEVAVVGGGGSGGFAIGLAAGGGGGGGGVTVAECVMAAGDSVVVVAGGGGGVASTAAVVYGSGPDYRPTGGRSAAWCANRLLAEVGGGGGGGVAGFDLGGWVVGSGSQGGGAGGVAPPGVWPPPEQIRPDDSGGGGRGGRGGRGVGVVRALLGGGGGGGWSGAGAVGGSEEYDSALGRFGRGGSGGAPRPLMWAATPVLVGGGGGGGNSAAFEFVPTPRTAATSYGSGGAGGTTYETDGEPPTAAAGDGQNGSDGVVLLRAQVDGRAYVPAETTP